MPTIEELDAMTVAVTGHRRFAEISFYDTKQEVMRMALDAKRNTILEAIQIDTNTIANVMDK